MVSFLFSIDSLATLTWCDFPWCNPPDGILIHLLSLSFYSGIQPLQDKEGARLETGGMAVYGLLFTTGFWSFLWWKSWCVVFLLMGAGAGLLGDDGAGMLMLAGPAHCVQLCSAHGVSKALPSLTSTPHTDLPREIAVLHIHRSCIL